MYDFINRRPLLNTLEWQLITQVIYDWWTGKPLAWSVLWLTAFTNDDTNNWFKWLKYDTGDSRCEIILQQGLNSQLLLSLPWSWLNLSSKNEGESKNFLFNFEFNILNVYFEFKVEIFNTIICNYVLFYRYLDE